MDQLICTSLSHTHYYWYAVGMLKVRVHATDSVKTEYLWSIDVSGLPGMLFGVNMWSRMSLRIFIEK